MSKIRVSQGAQAQLILPKLLKLEQAAISLHSESVLTKFQLVIWKLKKP